MRIALGSLVLVGCALATWIALARRAPAPAREARAASAAEIAAELGGTRTPAAAPPLPLEPRAGEAARLGAADGVGSELVGLNARALEALEAGRLEDAVRLLESARAEALEHPVLRANLAEALARLAGAERSAGSGAALVRSAELYARAAELAPQRADLGERAREVAALVASESDRWVDLSEHFELVYDGARADLLWSSSEITAVLERAYHELGELFGRFPVERGRERIRVVLYRRGEFHAVVPVGHWAAGVFDGSVRVPLEDLGRERAQLERVLRHEVAHAFVHVVGGSSVPAWLDEGLAQLLEEGEDRARRAAVARARERLLAVELFPLERLRGGLAAWQDAAAVTRAYDQALWLVDALASAYGERLPYELVAACAGDGGPEERFRALVGLSLEDAFRAAALDLR